MSERLTRGLLGPVPISDRDAERLEKKRELIDDIEGVYVCGTDYGKAELTVRLASVDVGTEQARREQINAEYAQLYERMKQAGMW